MRSLEIPLEILPEAEPEAEIERAVEAATGGGVVFHHKVILPPPLVGRCPSVYPDEDELPQGVRPAETVEEGEDIGNGALAHDVDGRIVYMAHSHEPDAMLLGGMPFKYTPVKIKVFGISIPL